MLTIALILFGLAAVVGLSLAMQHLKRGPAERVTPPPAAQQGPQSPPTPSTGVSVPIAVLHGILAAGGVVLLVIAVVQGAASGLATIALAIFVVAALGGAYLFVQHFGGKSLPKPIIFAHGGGAVLAFVLLLLYSFRG